MKKRKAKKSRADLAPGGLVMQGIAAKEAQRQAGIDRLSKLALVPGLEAEVVKAASAYIHCSTMRKYDDLTVAVKKLEACFR